MTQNIVITGAGRGIGLEMTTQLLAAGHRVFALVRNPGKSPHFVNLKESYPDRLNAYTVDVNHEDQVLGFVKELHSVSSIDVLINNAGVYGSSSNFEDVSLDEVLKTYSTNAIAPMRVTRALLPFLKKSKNPKVIHITSLMGSIADNESGNSYGYRMSKAALNMFHKSFSIDYPEITSLVIHPGWVKTEMGGPNAPTDVKDSARGIISVMMNATHKESGKFFDFEGDSLPW